MRIQVKFHGGKGNSKSLHIDGESDDDVIKYIKHVFAKQQATITLNVNEKPKGLYVIVGNRKSFSMYGITAIEAYNVLTDSLSIHEDYKHIFSNVYIPRSRS
jgi:hypothetical protein